MGLEGLGLAPGAAAAISCARSDRGRSLPVNTHGGLLSEGYLHGMNTVAEAVLQLQGRAGAAPSPTPRRAWSPRVP